MTRRISTGGPVPDPAGIAEIADVLSAGGIAILPTDTIYGLHALATDSAAIERIAEAKQRPPQRPLVVLCAHLEQARELGIAAEENILAGLEQLWPAPLTAILSLRLPIAATAGRDSIALRIPRTSWLRELLARTGPLASTSVNLSGEREVYSTEEIPEEIVARVDVILDSGILQATPSTLVDFTTIPPKVIREGEFFFTQKLWKTVWKSL